MDKIDLNNYNNKINFSGLKVTTKGSQKLVEAFQNKDMKFLTQVIDRVNHNISADVFVKDNEILVTPNKLTGLGPIRMKDITNNREVFKVDYLQHDIYDAFYNGYYTINQLTPKFPYFSKYNEVGVFGKLFAGACHIAENIDAIFHKKIVEAMNKEKKLKDIVNTLDLDIIDK